MVKAIKKKLYNCEFRGKKYYVHLRKSSIILLNYTYDIFPTSFVDYTLNISLMIIIIIINISIPLSKNPLLNLDTSRYREYTKHLRVLIVPKMRFT